MNQDSQYDRDERLGTVLLDKYCLDAVLGRGGMGTVYRARQLPIDRPVALKLISGVSSNHREEYIRRFKREAEAMARLRHPNTVRLFDFGVTGDGDFFMVMELLEGCDLAEHMQARGALPVAEALNILRDALGSLSEAHALGIVHRDIKPANIFLARMHDGRVTAKLTDFGVAHVGQNEDATKLTVAGAVMGTPAYMPPEQASGKEVDARSDLYSLGITFFQMITGRLPFESDSVVGMLVEHVTKPPPSLAEKCPDRTFSQPLQRLLDALLSKDPQRRPADATRALHEVETLLQSEGQARDDTRDARQQTVAAATPHTPEFTTSQPIAIPKTMFASGISFGRAHRLGLGALLCIPLGAAAAYGTRFVPARQDPAPTARGPQPNEPSHERPANPPLEPSSNGALNAPIDEHAQRAREQPEFPTVTIKSVPTQAKLMQGDRELGKTPLSMQIRAPLHATLKLPNYASHDLDLSATSKSTITIRLVPLTAATLPTAMSLEPAKPAAPASAAPQHVAPQQALAAPRAPAQPFPVLRTMPRHERQQAMLLSGPPYHDLASAKLGYQGGVIDSAFYDDIVWALKKRRGQRIDAEKLSLRSGAITRDEYARRLQQIERNYKGE